MQNNNITDRTIRIGTRGSKLALWQAGAAAEKLQTIGFKTEIVIFSTKGDQILDKSLDKLGSKGVFTEELEIALRQGEIEIAVHSAKDVQSTIPADLELVAFMEREQVNDVLLSLNPDFKLERDSKAVIGTSSTRRKAQLKHYYPHITTVESRGNLQTRLRKLEEQQLDALMLAYAGVFRVGYDNLIVHIFPDNEFVPAAGQGSVAIECAISLEPELKQLLKQTLNHPETYVCLQAERGFLRTMEGGCSIPSFALAKLTEQGLGLRITGGIVSLDGKTLLQEELEGPAANAEAMGEQLANIILGQGGDEILRSIKSVRAEV